MALGRQTDFGSRLVQKMVYLYLLISVVYIHVGLSESVPPRVGSCRDVFKAKRTDVQEVHEFDEGAACVPSVLLPVLNKTLFLVDPRNCANFYRCAGPTCEQCPCPLGQMFDPLTQQCSTDASPCVCPGGEPTTTTLPAMTTAAAPPSTARPAAAEPTSEQVSWRKTFTSGATTDAPVEVDNGVVIIAAMVSATVVILVLLVVGFVLWQRGLFHLHKKPQMVPASNDGYLHTLPAQERHVYAEIDERMISENNNNGDSGGHLSDRGSTARPACVHHPHQTYTLPQGFYAASAIFPGQPRTAGLSPPPHARADSCDNSSVTSCSGCSHCSATTNQTQLDGAANLDRRTLLRTGPPQWGLVSKQVYV